MAITTYDSPLETETFTVTVKIFGQDGLDAAALEALFIAYIKALPCFTLGPSGSQVGSLKVSDCAVS